MFNKSNDENAPFNVPNLNLKKKNHDIQRSRQLG